jgi:DNA-binding phage protein
MSKTYSKKEISKILTKASEIQTAKDLYDDVTGLTKEELMHVAEEVGISHESLVEALSQIDDPDLNKQSYNILKGTSRIQDVSNVKGEITDDQWEDLVLEIRKITGGIGKINKVGNTYEWEQRKSDFGYKHFSFTPKNGQTKIQMVSSWGPFKTLASFLSFFFGFIIALIAFKEINGKQFALMVAPFFGLGGFAMSRFFLKSYYQKQKDQLSTLTASISKKIASFGNTSGPIEIEDEDLYQKNANSPSSQSKERDT